ncbi:MAG: hypothetical protein H6Q90_3370 [Deltaproteobacteria bacterium]|nr:hypothetical protein [Deltaproteobacteria bacterium]
MGWPRKVPYTKAMSSRLAARTVVVCTLICQVAIAWAQPASEAPPTRRPVAVIDLTETDAGEALAKDLGNELNNHLDLKPIDDQSLFAELLGAFKDEDADRLEDARKSRLSAQQRLSQFDFPTAAEHAIAGQDALAYATPTPAIVAVYAELSFVLGQARLGERKPDPAAAAFALTHQLDPGFTPDAARYLPEVVQAFEAARSVSAGIGKIAVTGTGRVWIDGKAVGDAPAGFDAPAGQHVVWLTGPERDPRAKRVTVIAQRKVQADIDDAPTGLATRIRRARIALKHAPDASARASAMYQIAELLKVSDAVVLTGAPGGGVIVQTWRDRAPGFSALREHTRGEQPSDLLAPLAPPPRKAPKPVEPPPPKIPVVEKRWYQRTSYRAGMIATGVAIVAGILAIRSIDRTVSLDPNPQTGSARR